MSNILKNAKKKSFRTENIGFKVSKEEKKVITDFMKKNDLVTSTAIREILLDFIKKEG